MELPVYWSKDYGAFPIWSEIAQRYERLGGTGGRLGFPISLELETSRSERGTSGQVQRFQEGKDDPSGVAISIYCSQYGAFATWGWIARCYERLGGTGSRSGFPISPEFPAAQSPQKTVGKCNILKVTTTE